MGVFTKILANAVSSSTIDELRSKVDALESIRARLIKENATLRTDVAQISQDLAAEREKHSKASFRINEMKKAYEDQIVSLNAEILRLRNMNAAQTEAAKSGGVGAQREIRALKQQLVDAARVLSVAIYGDDADPIYAGETIAPSWWTIAATSIARIRQQNSSIKTALLVFVPWFNQVLRTRVDDHEIIHEVPAHGSLHNYVIRRSDIRIVRELLESIK